MTNLNCYQELNPQINRRVSNKKALSDEVDKYVEQQLRGNVQ